MPKNEKPREVIAERSKHNRELLDLHRKIEGVGGVVTHTAAEAIKAKATALIADPVGRAAITSRLGGASALLRLANVECEGAIRQVFGILEGSPRDYVKDAFASIHSAMERLGEAETLLNLHLPPVKKPEAK